MDDDPAGGFRPHGQDRIGSRNVSDKNFVGAGEEGRTDSDSNRDGQPRSVEDLWLERWAFGTALPPYGLGLANDFFWALSHREVAALRKRFIDHRKMDITLTAGLRADIRNAAGWKKENGQPWYPWDFGADEPVEAPQRGISKEVLKSRLIGRFGPKGKSVLSTLKGQPIPIRKQA